MTAGNLADRSGFVERTRKRTVAERLGSVAAPTHATRPFLYLPPYDGRGPWSALAVDPGMGPAYNFAPRESCGIA